MAETDSDGLRKYFKSLQRACREGLLTSIINGAAVKAVNAANAGGMERPTDLRDHLGKGS